MHLLQIIGFILTVNMGMFGRFDLLDAQSPALGCIPTLNNFQNDVVK